MDCVKNETPMLLMKLFPDKGDCKNVWWPFGRYLAFLCDGRATMR